MRYNSLQIFNRYDSCGRKFGFWIEQGNRFEGGLTLTPYVLGRKDGTQLIFSEESLQAEYPHPTAMRHFYNDSIGEFIINFNGRVPANSVTEISRIKDFRSDSPEYKYQGFMQIYGYKHRIPAEGWIIFSLEPFRFKRVGVWTFYPFNGADYTIDYGEATSPPNPTR